MAFLKKERTSFVWTGLPSPWFPVCILGSYIFPSKSELGLNHLFLWCSRGVSSAYLGVGLRPGEHGCITHLCRMFLNAATKACCWLTLHKCSPLEASQIHSTAAPPYRCVISVCRKSACTHVTCLLAVICVYFKPGLRNRFWSEGHICYIEPFHSPPTTVNLGSSWRPL